MTQPEAGANNFLSFGIDIVISAVFEKFQMKRAPI